MTDTTRNGDLLRVANPYARNTQQNRENGGARATAHATATQQPGLKALAQLALARNSHATSAQQPDATGAKTAQQTGLPEGPFVAQEMDVLRVAFPRPRNTQQLERLLELADAEGIEHELVETIPDADLADCIGLPDDLLRAYLFALRDSDLRQRGIVPDGETAVIRCASCGPVYADPDVAAVLPIVDGLPRALGCPWCHVARDRVPYPEVQP